MGCGCSKNKTASLPASRVITADTATHAVARSTNVVEYDVFDGKGSLIASYSNPVTARAEARRTGGTTVPRKSITTGTTTKEEEPSHG